MKRLISILLLLMCDLTFAQDIDTSFVIKTEKSEIKVVCKRNGQNRSNQSMQALIVTLKINQNTIDEAEKNGINTGNYYVKLHYNSNCDLSEISTLRVSPNSSFNSEVEQYFKEFIDAYNSNDLKKYLKESTQDCGVDKLSFSYFVE